MPDLILYFSTAAAWLVLSANALRASRLAFATAPADASRGELRLDIVLVPVALVLHGALLYRHTLSPEGLDLGFANAISMLVWLTVLIYWLASLAFEGLTGMLGMTAPIAFIAVALMAFVSTHHYVDYGGDPIFVLHFGVAMLAYSLFIVATVHAVVMLAEEKGLHRGVLSPFLRTLPPLLVMEALLFRILLAAFVLLTLTVLSGIFFSEQLFHKPFELNQKTVFAIVSWFIFGGLLAGHHLRGWRGRTAAYWTFAGFTALLLAYVGSKAVLELILHRA